MQWNHFRLITRSLKKIDAGDGSCPLTTDGSLLPFPVDAILPCKPYTEGGGDEMGVIADAANATNAKAREHDIHDAELA
ncbi:MAG: hypothetical protein Q6373_014800 [Candidatus Sigynarchaeota archaeon]